MWQFHRVMKTTETLKEHDFKPKYEALLRGLLGRVPFVKVKSFGHIAEAFGNQPDWLVEVKAGERPWVLAVESKRHGQPREVRNGLLQLRQFLDQTKGKSCYGVLVAPFLSEESARLCTEAGIGYADLAGNARLSFDQVFIETHATDNPFREKRETRSLFAPRATRVLRVLLQGPLRPWKVTELAQSARVRPGWVNAVRFVVPKDDGVLYPTQTERGFPLVSDVQIYLDLLRAGQRGEEQAEELRKWPDFAGGWG